jgi:hypothetical protein
MSNIYELHLSVSLGSGKEEIAWLDYCKKHHFHSIKVFNMKGVHSVQDMMSKWCHRDSEESVIEYLKQLQKDATDAGFKVVRSKAEAMMMSREYDNIVLNNSKGKYWEFHFKVTDVTCSELLQLLKDVEDVGVSASAYSGTRYPIVTIRKYQGSRKEVMQYKDNVIEKLKKLGYHIFDKIQAEISIYDSFPEEDQGWINNQ